MIETVISALLLVLLGAVITALAFAAWLCAASDREDEHWPDDDPTLDVENHIGDARPTYRDRRVAYERWADWDA